MTQLKAVTKEQAKSYARAVGCSVVKALPMLAAMEPELRERILLAAATQSGQYLRDPVESDPRYADAISQARALANAEVHATEDLSRRGAALHIWHIQARILREQFGIDWLSPRQMNPHILFD